MTCFLEEFEEFYSELLSVFREDDVNSLQSLQARFPQPHSLIASVDKQGNTLLHQAIYHKSEKIFDYLLTVDDAPINTYNLNGVSPFMFAFNAEARDFTLKLIRKGCNIDKRIKKELGHHYILPISPLHCSVELEWYEVTKALIERGADLNKRNFLGQSPLYVACKKRLVDQVFLLLFYGADAIYTVGGSQIESPNLLAFFEDASIQDLYFKFVAQTNTVHIKTIVKAMRDDSPNFSKLLEVTKYLKFSSSRDVEYYICRKLEHFPPNYFKMFLEKFGDVIEDALGEICASCPCGLQLYVYRNQITGNDVSLLQQYAENLCHILNSNFVEKLIPNIKRFYRKYKGHDMITCLLYKRTQYESNNRNELESITRLICCLLNHGASVTCEAMDLLFELYGHCDLFKMLLHMPIRYYKVRNNRSFSLMYDVKSVNNRSNKSIVPRLMYDVHMSINKYLELLSQFPNYHNRQPNDLSFSLISLCDYSALPKLKQHRLSNYSFDRKLVERMEKLPNVPSLVEFGRNSARAFITKKFKIQNSSQFYTILGKLTIAEIHRKIIAFETKLYPA